MKSTEQTGSSPSERAREPQPEVPQPRTEPEPSLPLLSATLESTADGILVLNPEGKVAFRNRKFLGIWGSPVDLLAGADPEHLLTLCSAQTTDAEHFLKRLAQFGVATEHDRVEWFQLKDGRTLECIAIPRRIGNQTAGIVLNVRDVTGLKRAEAALTETSALLEGLLANSPELIYFKDLQSRLIKYSRSFGQRFGLEDSEALKGKTDFDLYSEAHAWPAFEDEQQIIRTGESMIGKLEKETHTDGHVTWVLTSKMPWRDSHGNVIGTYGISEDVTAFKEAEASFSEASAQLEALLANCLDLIYFKDAQSRFVRYSRSLTLHFGLTDPQALKGKTDCDCYTEDRARAAYEDEQRIVRTGQPLISKLEKGMRSDGLVTWVLTTKMPWLDNQGNIIGTYGISRDVTSLKVTEAELAETSSLLETMLENTPDRIYFKDRQSRFVRYSKSMLHLARVSDPDGLKGKTDFDIFLEEHARAAFEDEQEIMRTGQPLIGKPEKETHPDGRITWALSTKLPWRDQQGNIIGTYGLSKDITAIKEAEIKLEQLHKQLLVTSRLAGMAEVAADVLHNVGNVLNNVNVSASCVINHLRQSRVGNLAKAVALLREHAADLATFLTTDPRGGRLLGYLEQVTESLTADRDSLIGEMLLLSRSIERIKEIVAAQNEYARVSGVVETVKIADLIEDALRLTASPLPEQDAVVSREFDPQLPEMTGDRHKMLLILGNLIRNARYACQESGREDRRLTIRATREADCVRIGVIDNGVGIPRENLSRLFNQGFTTRKDGHGLSLHNAALAAKELGGSLVAHSDGPGTGATFILELPFRAP